MGIESNADRPETVLGTDGVIHVPKDVCRGGIVVWRCYWLTILEWNYRQLITNRVGTIPTTMERDPCLGSTVVELQVKRCLSKSSISIAFE